MVKSINAIREAVRNSKHTFHQLESQPDKAHRHRYERRKVRQIMRLGDWGTEMEAEPAS
jgi:hypothetical protein